MVGELPDFLHGNVDEFLADGVVAPGVVIGRVFLPRQQLLGVEQLAVVARPHLICGRRRRMVLHLLLLYCFRNFFYVIPSFFYYYYIKTVTFLLLSLLNEVIDTPPAKAATIVT